MNKVSNLQPYAASVLVLAMTPTLAQAYIDPGSGAYMVQALFALIGAGLFYVRHPIRSLRALARWFARRGRKDGGFSNDGVALETEGRHVSLTVSKANSSSDEAH